MPSRRFYIATAPVSHINGKMAPQSVKCSNSYDPDSEPEVSFWYGYRYYASPSVSRYGIRTQRRDLSVKPYTALEDENRTLFRASLLTVYEHKRNPADWRLMFRDFEQQKRYHTPLGYAIAETRLNQGEWRRDWTA